MSHVNHPVTVAFFGISGSGKGTQAQLLEEYLKKLDPASQVIRPDMGALLRAFMQTGTPLATKMGDILKSGGLVPSFMPISLLVEAFDSTFDGTQHVILDGTCRRPDQSRAVNDLMRLWGREDLHVVVLDLSKEDAKERLLARGRFDDKTTELIDARFSWYEEQVVPSINELGSAGWTVHHVDAGPGIEAIHQDILQKLGLV